MHTLQYFDYNGVQVTFLDFDQQTHSQPAQPRDIHITDPLALNVAAVRLAIAADIRQHQPYPCPRSLHFKESF